MPAGSPSAPPSVPPSGPPSGTAQPAPAGWHAWLLSGLLPLSLLGLAASALADRLVFLLWTALATVAYAAAVRRSFAVAPAAGRRRALPVAVLCGGLALFAALSAVHRGALAEGLAAMLPGSP